MTGIGNLVIDLIAQTASFNADITKAAGHLNSNAAKMNRSLQNIEAGFSRMKTGAAALTAAFSGGAFIAAGARALDYAASLGEVSQQIGVSIRDLQVYRYIGTQVNLTQEEMEKSLAKLTATIGKAALGSKSESAAFDALGISTRDVAGHVKDASDIMPELADRLARIPDPAKRAAVEVALFGRAGQKLDPLLTQGSKGIQAFAEQADKLGIVLDDDLSNAADKAADRVAELKMQLEANFARTVAENANSILVMANSLSMLAVKIADFWAQNPEKAYAIIGGLAGARVGGLPGAAAGAVGGYLLGEKQKAAAADANMDLGYRKAELQKALDKLKGARQAPGVKYESKLGLVTVRSGDTLGEATARVNHQRYLLQQATVAAMNPRGSSGPQIPEFELPDFLAGGGKKGAKEVDTFTAAMERLKQQTEDLRAEFQSIDESWSEADIATAKIETDAFRVVQENSAKWSQAQKDAYIASAKELARMSDQTIWAKEKLEELSVMMEHVSNNPIELDIDIAGQLERDTQRLIDQMPDLRTQWQQFWDSMEEMGPDAFDAITDGIEDVLLGFSSIGDAIRNVVAELAHMAMQAFIFQPLKDALFGVANAAGGGGGGGGGFLGSLLNIGASVASSFGGGFSGGSLTPANFAQLDANVGGIGSGGSLPGFASGTDFAPGGMAIVGELGPELVNLPRGSKVTPNSRLSSGFERALYSLPDRRSYKGPLVGQMVFPNVRTAREARETMQQANAHMRRVMADGAKAGY